MPAGLRVMELLGVALLVAGLPLLGAPCAMRAALGLRPTPQLAYLLRIGGAMLASLGLVLVVFARSYWAAGGG